MKSHHGFMKAYARALIDKLTGPGAVFLVSCSISMTCAIATLFRWIEHDANPNVTDWFDSLYFTVTTMTGVGFGDIVPVTHGGRVVSMLAMLAGTAIFAGFTALIASAIFETDRDPRWEDRGRQS
ncbi:MAG: potassium channel family protein [Planctomycetota bacterium]|nr:potassium channel family protein [Planctomycetota bacterium]